MNNTGYGICLKYTCNNNIIEGNKISYNAVNNIHQFKCYDNIISNNVISNSKSGRGVYIIRSSSNNITNNTITGNKQNGIEISWDSTYNTIVGNSIADNNPTGITIDDGSNYNLIYHNNFITNHQQAYDECTNIWYNISRQEGNYWSDFDEPSEGAWDNDSDGRVDSPYDIPGGANQDLYPFINQGGWIGRSLCIW